MKWYETTVNALHPGQTYTHGELMALLKEDYPYVSANSYQWALQDMLKSRSLVKIGYNQYQIPGKETKSAYTPRHSEFARELVYQIAGKYPDIRFVLIEAALINEFLDSPVSMNVLIIQIEKGMGMPIFQYLQEQGYPGLIYRPTRRIFDLYRTQNCILFADLVSESPVNLKQPHEVCIEKLLVDMLCDKYVGWAYDNAAFKPAFERAARQYLIDKPRLLRYAGRRGKRNEIIMTLPGFMDEKLIEDAKFDRKNDLERAAAEIILSLPDSQQKLYRDINGGKLTQADMARYYHVTPQAITNRINRLYKTVSRRLQEEYGFSESEIRKFGKGTAISFFRNVWL